MASENETVADAIAAERRRIERAKADAEEDLEIECAFTDEEVGEIIDRIEAAHGREVAELKKAYDHAVAADVRHAMDVEHLRREVAELRQCLRAALASEYGRCRSRWPCALCSKNCNVKRWRKALEGAN